MSKPDTPKDPGSLSLKPSSGRPAAATGTADFSRVRSSVDSTEAVAGAPKGAFDNVRSSVSSTEEAVGERTYTVERGDTLSHIAKAHYGKASAWRTIYDANRDQLDDPDRIQPGQVLRIPAAPGGDG